MSILQNWCLRKAHSKQKRLEEFLQAMGKTLDVGTGNGALVHLLRMQGKQIESIDVVNKSVFEDVKPQLYDGNKFPFPDKTFETVMLITMLHHTPNPELILGEAKRTGKNLIVMEDVYSNPLQKRLTFFVDSLVNREFRDHPHTNKSDEQWRNCFEELGLQVIGFRKDRFLLFFTQTIYHLRAVERP